MPPSDTEVPAADSRTCGYHPATATQIGLGQSANEVPSEEIRLDWQPRRDLGSISIAEGLSQSLAGTKASSWPMERWLVSQMLRWLDQPQLDVQLWDGKVISPSSKSPRQYRLQIRQRAALWKLLFNPAYHFGEGVLLIGDAAGLADPHSGEGIRPAIESGLLAAETIHAARGHVGRQKLSWYAKKLQQRFGRRPSDGATFSAPGNWQSRLLGFLIGNRWFSRLVILNRWFLHARLPALLAQSSTS